MNETTIPRNEEDPFGSAFRLDLEDGEWKVSQMDGDIYPATSREIALWKYALDVDGVVHHWKGNHARETRLKREANARVRILRTALDHAKAVLEHALDHQLASRGAIPDATLLVNAVSHVNQALARTGKRGMPK